MQRRLGAVTYIGRQPRLLERRLFREPKLHFEIQERLSRERSDFELKRTDLGAIDAHARYFRGCIDALHAAASVIGVERQLGLVRQSAGEQVQKLVGAQVGRVY